MIDEREPGGGSPQRTVVEQVEEVLQWLRQHPNLQA